MPNQTHLRLLEQGVEVWNEWRKANPKVIPDLTKVNFSGFNDGGINARINLSPQDLSFADFRQATLDGSDLRGEINLPSILFDSRSIPPQGESNGSATLGNGPHRR